jgi:hypothetical protein
MNPEANFGIAHGPRRIWPRIWAYLESRAK